MAKGKNSVLRFARIESVDFKEEKLEQCQRSKKKQGRVRRKRDVSLSKRECYRKDCKNEGRDESGLKRLKFGFDRLPVSVRMKAAMKAD